MKVNNDFKETIKAYLDQKALDDALFADTLKKENKNIDNCCNYIISQAKKQASRECAVISDDVVFSWAVHYYDEDDIQIENTSNIRSEVKTWVPQKEAGKEIPQVKNQPKKKEDVNQLSLF